MASTSDFSGPNDWLIEEIRQQYLANPRSVSPEWRDTFEGTAPPTPNGTNGHAPAATNGAAPAPVTNGAAALPAAAPAAAPQAPAQPQEAPKPKAEADEEEGEPLRGVSARIVANMESSLTVPTATSFREIPSKLLEINRKVLNNHLVRVRGGKTSFTHLIGYAIVRAISETVPAMNNVYLEGKDGKPRIIRKDYVNLGIAVDQQKADGSRALIVPVIKNADQMNFAEFVDAYEALIRKVRENKIAVDDLMGANVSLTNVGTIGTVQSVPRLMPGQGVIVGVGRMDFPTAFQAADPKLLAQIGISKTMTMTSTYDHRIIQGAESGVFLKRVHELLLGEDDFYQEAFGALDDAMVIRRRHRHRL